MRTGMFWANAGAAQMSASAANAQNLLLMGLLPYFSKVIGRLDFHVVGFNPTDWARIVISPQRG
jgi:hypothetical protein